MSTDYKKIFGQKDIILTDADRDRIASEAESVGYLKEYFNKKQNYNCNCSQAINNFKL